MAESIAVVLELDRRSGFKDWSEFDSALWQAVCEVVESRESLDDLPEPVRVYYATRYLEWEVGNGGFAQAAMNIPELFEPAARGYEVLGKPKLAKFVRDAARLAEREGDNIDAAREGRLEGTFEYFRERTFDDFDKRLDEVGWFKNDEQRLDYVRSHREIFASAVN